MTDRRFAVPLPPSLNHYYRKDEWGNPKVSKKGKGYRLMILERVLRGQIPRVGNGLVAMHIEFHPHPQGGDIDNYDKCLFDALTHADAWNDDRQVIARSAQRRAPLKGGALVVSIRAANKREITLSETHSEHIQEMQR